MIADGTVPVTERTATSEYVTCRSVTTQSVGLTIEPIPVATTRDVLAATSYDRRRRLVGITDLQTASEVLFSCG
jgi:hypothetical protein